MKGLARKWIESGYPFPPAPKRLRGRWVLVHPTLFRKNLGSNEDFVFEWIHTHLQRGGTFFDVGAHWGMMSLFAAQRAKRVVAFEPAPFLAQILRYHRRVNHCAHLDVVEKAVASYTSPNIEFFLLNDGNSYRNSLTIGPDSTPFVSPQEKLPIAVASTTLDDYCKLTGHYPDLIKIDVEGAEQMVIEGGRNVCREAKPKLIVSLHEYWMPAGQSERSALELLYGLGYRIEQENIAAGCGARVRDVLAVPSR